MTSPAIAPDRFEWSRVWATMHLMLPRLRATIAWYAATGIVASVATLLISPYPLGFQLISLLLFVPAMLFNIAPIFVLDTMTPGQATLIPATSGEKLIAAYLYIFLILTPIAYLLPSLIFKIQILNHGLSLDNALADSLSYVRGMSPALWAMSFLAGGIAPIVGAYTLIRCPRRRWLAVGMILLTVFIEGCIGGIYGVFMAVKKGFEAGISGASPNIDSEVLTREIVDSMTPYLWVFSTICIIVEAMFIIATYRRLKYRQI